jgi:excisionase family DNA binding protein
VTDKDDPLLTRQEAAAYLGYSVRTIDRYLARRELRAVGGRRVLMYRSECDRFRHREESETPIYAAIKAAFLADAMRRLPEQQATVLRERLDPGRMASWMREGLVERIRNPLGVRLPTDD